MKCICSKCNMDIAAYFERTREFELLSEIEALLQAGYSRYVLFCPTCESNQEFRLTKSTEGTQQMSHETGNPDLNGVTPMNPAPVVEAPASAMSPEMIGAALSIATETAQAIADIPAQIEFNAFVNLSTKFMYPSAEGKTLFNEEGFLKLWGRLNTLYENQQKGAESN